MELESKNEQLQLPTGKADEGASTLAETITLPAPGEYDLEKQLTPEQIIELKESFKNNHRLLPEVCTHIVMEMLLESEERREAHRVKAEASGGSFVTNITYETREDFAQHVGLLSASWAQHLQRAVSMPGSEWPEDITSPATFVEVIKDMERIEKEEAMAKDVAAWLIDHYDVQVKGFSDPTAEEIEINSNSSESEERAVLTMLGIQARSEYITVPENDFTLTEFGDQVLRACNVLREHPPEKQ